MSKIHLWCDKKCNLKLIGSVPWLSCSRDVESGAALTYIPVGNNTYKKRGGSEKRVVKMRAESFVRSNQPAVEFVVCSGRFRVAPDNIYPGFPTLR